MLITKSFKDNSGKEFFRCEFLESGVLRTTWYGNMMDIAASKEAAYAVVELLVESKSTKLLDDNRLGQGPWADIKDWLMEEWIPMLVNTGLVAYAHVLSPDLDAKEPDKILFNQTVKGVSFVTFDSYATAQDWLNSL